MLEETCKVCGLPKDLCVCDTLEKKEVSSISVSFKKAKFNKYVTIVKLEGASREQLKDLLKDLKRKLACGGSLGEKNEIILQGDHRRKIKDVLVNMGFSEDMIEVL